MIDKNDAKATTKNKPKPLHKRWWMWLIIIGLVIAGIGNIIDPSDDDDHKSSTESYRQSIHKVDKKIKAKDDNHQSHSQNIPGQKINKSKATKHKFYWTDNDDSKLRYFVDNEGKITAVKYVKPNNNTYWCQQIISVKILHDDHVKFGNDKEDIGDGVLANDESYNIYSPKLHKWFWVHFDAADGKNMVASFAVYPNKSDEAE